MKELVKDYIANIDDLMYDAVLVVPSMLSIEDIDLNGGILCGTVYSDLKGRFLDGSYIHTSKVKIISHYKGYSMLETMNTTYLVIGSDDLL